MRRSSVSSPGRESRSFAEGDSHETDVSQARFPKMGDLDILIEEGKQEICRDLMEGMGYEVLEYGQYHHDVYAKGCVRVELHNALFHEKEIGWQQPYFENIMDRTFLSITNRKVRFFDG